MNKRMKIALCVLIAAAVMTAAAVILLSGSGNSYETVFRAGVKSLFDADNKTIKGTFKITFDGETETDIEYLLMHENGSRYRSETDHLKGETDETYDFPERTYSDIDHENKTYKMYDKSWNSIPSENPQDEDSMQDTVVRIIKLFSDFYMGNVKNQFVREPMADGNRYTLMLKTEQFPDLVNLFVNLFNELQELNGRSDGVTTVYMDKDAAVRAYHKKFTGEEIDERLIEEYFSPWAKWAKPDNQLLNDAYSEFVKDMENMYSEAGENVASTACVFVNEDGNYEVYASKKDMYIKRLSENLPLPAGTDELLYPNDLTIEYFRAEFEVSEEGYITHISLKGEVSIQDVLEKTHTGTLEAEFDIDDYNTTKITMFDLDAYTRKEETVSSMPKYVITDATIEFLGKAYEVNYQDYLEE